MASPLQGLFVQRGDAMRCPDETARGQRSSADLHKLFAEGAGF